MLIKNSKKIVIKLGSSTVVDGKGKFKKKWVTSLIKDIKKFREKSDLVIVSSGAIALGQNHLKIKKKKIKLEMSQAIAAVGQIHLAGEFQKLFDKYKIKTGQILISPDDTEQRRRALNVRRTFDNLFKLKAVPIVNENDTTATTEIKYGDNDRLAARVAQMIDADLLILLSDVDGLYDKNPYKNKDAKKIKEIFKINKTIEQMGNTQTSSLGSGGMVTKIAAAKICMNNGCDTIITHSEKTYPLSSISQKNSSIFFANKNPSSSR